MSIVYVEAVCVACGGAFKKKSGAHTKIRCDACQKARDAQKKLEWAKTAKGRACARRHNFVRYHRDREKEIERAKTWKAENHDKVLAYNRKWYREHREQALESGRRYACSEQGRLRRQQRKVDVIARRERVRGYYWGNRDHVLLLKRLRYRIQQGNVLAKMEHAKALGKLLRCDRLHLSAITLPCGQYPSCHKCPQDQRRRAR